MYRRSFFYAGKELKPPDSNSTVSEPFLGWVFGTAIAKKQFSTLDLRKNACFSYCKYVSANSFFKEIQHKIYCVNFNQYRRNRMNTGFL